MPLLLLNQSQPLHLNQISENLFSIIHLFSYFVKREAGNYVSR